MSSAWARIAEESLRRMTTMTDWQPIETAPRDGTEFIGFEWTSPETYTQYVCWRDGDEWVIDGDGLGWVRPTLWQPLLPPPERS